MAQVAGVVKMAACAFGMRGDFLKPHRLRIIGGAIGGASGVRAANIEVLAVVWRWRRGLTWRFRGWRYRDRWRPRDRLRRSPYAITQSRTPAPLVSSLDALGNPFAQSPAEGLAAFAAIFAFADDCESAGKVTPGRRSKGPPFPGWSVGL